MDNPFYFLGSRRVVFLQKKMFGEGACFMMNKNERRMKTYALWLCKSFDKGAKY